MSKETVLCIGELDVGGLLGTSGWVHLQVELGGPEHGDSNLGLRDSLMLPCFWNNCYCKTPTILFTPKDFAVTKDFQRETLSKASPQLRKTRGATKELKREDLLRVTATQKCNAFNLTFKSTTQLPDWQYKATLN